MSLLLSLVNDKILDVKSNIPSLVVDGLVYETVIGSHAYGVAKDNSDVDVYGFCIPPKELVFPHLAGHILGFGTRPQSFDQWQAHHIKNLSQDTEYDFSIYNIVKYFSLVMENNPNMIDSLFTADDCVTHSSKISEMVRSKRDLFLHKGSWHKFKGYAYSQIAKMKNKAPIGKRKESFENFGFDVKFGYHAVRLINEAEQILKEGTIDLRKNTEMLTDIRAGKWQLSDIETFFAEKEPELDELYKTSTLQHSPDETKIRSLLINCLEEAWGSVPWPVGQIN